MKNYDVVFSGFMLELFLYQNCNVLGSAKGPFSICGVVGLLLLFFPLFPACESDCLSFL